MREDCPRILSILATKFGDVDIADEAVQLAMIDATRAWPEHGIPDNPGGWIMATARRRALDQVRNEHRRRDRLKRVGSEIVEQVEIADDTRSEFIDDRAAHDGDDPSGGDERLRLMLLCCHPVLDRNAQVALTLRLVGGLTTPEISAAFVVPEATLAQRIVRAKRRIRDAGTPMDLPVALDERIDAVLGVLYLIFNEGYLTSTEANQTIRGELVDEAIRLTTLIVELAPDLGEPRGLLALELFHQARASSRVDELGDLVLLDDQDRSTWDQVTIDRANDVLTAALDLFAPGPYQLQALIASIHTNARTAAETDWSAIAGIYAQLEAVTPSPIVSLNRAVAVSMADGPNVGLAIVDQLDGLDSYHLYWAVVGELRLRAGEELAAADAFAQALALTGSPAEQRHLERRIVACGRM